MKYHNEVFLHHQNMDERTPGPVRGFKSVPFFRSGRGKDFKHQFLEHFAPKISTIRNLYDIIWKIWPQIRSTKSKWPVMKHKKQDPSLRNITFTKISGPRKRKVTVISHLLVFLEKKSDHTSTLALISEFLGPSTGAISGELIVPSVKFSFYGPYTFINDRILLENALGDGSAFGIFHDLRIWVNLVFTDMHLT